MTEIASCAPRQRGDRLLSARAVLPGWAWSPPVRPSLRSGATGATIRFWTGHVRARGIRGSPLPAQTDAHGRFVFTGLAPGVYTVTVFLAGFGEVTVDDIVVVADPVALPDIERRAIGNLTALSHWTPGLTVVDQGTARWTCAGTCSGWRTVARPGPRPTSPSTCRSSRASWGAARLRRSLHRLRIHRLRLSGAHAGHLRAGTESDRSRGG